MQALHAFQYRPSPLPHRQFALHFSLRFYVCTHWYMMRPTATALSVCGLSVEWSCCFGQWIGLRPTSKWSNLELIRLLTIKEIIGYRLYRGGNAVELLGRPWGGRRKTCTKLVLFLPDLLYFPTPPSALYRQKFPRGWAGYLKYWLRCFAYPFPNFTGRG